MYYNSHVLALAIAAQSQEPKNISNEMHIISLFDVLSLPLQYKYNEYFTSLIVL